MDVIDTNNWLVVEPTPRKNIISSYIISWDDYSIPNIWKVIKKKKNMVPVTINQIY